MDELSLEIIKELKQRVPKGVTLIDFFTKIIPIKKEAAYRRLRGDIPFTLKEAQQIASYLHLSLDKILKIKEKGTFSFNIIRMNRQNLISAYNRTMETSIQAMQYMKADPDAKIYGAINTLPSSHIFLYPTICKFRFFKWAYQFRNAPNPLKMAEIEVPPSVRHIEKTFREIHQQVASYYISIKDLFEPYTSDIHYFMELGLISKDEVNLLREETYQLLEDLEEDISSGKTKFGSPFIFYLANTYFDSNYVYIDGNNLKGSAINIFGMNYLGSIEEEINNDTKEWIDSLMRYSTLISVTGEIEKVNFFNQQRKMIKKLHI